MPTPARRPLSAVFFGQSVLSPFQTEGILGRSDAVTSSTDNRVSGAADEEGNVRDQEGVFNADRALCKPPPATLSLVSDVFVTEQFNTARTSRTLIKDRMSRSYSFEEKDYGSRPASRALPRPVSCQSAYPKRLYIATNGISDFPQPAKQTRRMRLRSKFSREKVVDEPKLPAESLPIRHILRTIWPVINWKSRLALFAALLATLLHAIATPVFAWVFSQLLATFYATEDTKANALRYVLIILGIAVADGGLKATT